MIRNEDDTERVHVVVDDTPIPDSYDSPPFKFIEVLHKTTAEPVSYTSPMVVTACKRLQKVRESVLMETDGHPYAYMYVANPKYQISSASEAIALRHQQ